VPIAAFIVYRSHARRHLAFRCLGVDLFQSLSGVPDKFRDLADEGLNH